MPPPAPGPTVPAGPNIAPADKKSNTKMLLVVGAVLIIIVVAWALLKK
jgi:hypothetical protein